MTKRFTTNGYYINDTYHDGRKWLVNEVEAKEIVDVMNNLDMKARERSKALSKLQKNVDEQQATIRRLQDLCGESDGENAKLRIENKKLQEEIKLLKPTNIEQYEQIQKLQEENEQLRTQLLQQSNDDGQFQVWEVPPIPKGTRITFSTSGKNE